MGVESKSSEHYSNKVEDEPAPPPAYTPYASDSVDQSTPQESSRSMPQQAEYMYRNSAQPVPQGQPSDPSQWNAPAPHAPPSNYQDQYQKYQDRYDNGQYRQYQDRYENGQYQQYQDRYQNGQYQQYQDRYQNGQIQQYQDRYQNGQYQQHEQKYRDRYQQYLPQNLPPNLPPRPNPPLQRPPTQGMKPCVIPQSTKVLGSYMTPFVRARVPELEQQAALPTPELVAFIDGLNDALVPLGTTQTIGASPARTKAYIKHANDTIFRTRGLHVQICKTEKMLFRIGIPNDGSNQYRTTLEAEVPVEQRMMTLGDRVMRLSFEGGVGAPDMPGLPGAPNNWMQNAGCCSSPRAERKLARKQAREERKYSRSGRKKCKDEREMEEVGDKIVDLKEEMEDVMLQVQSSDLGHCGKGKKCKDLKKDLKDLKKDLRDAEEKYEDLLEKVDEEYRKRGKHGWKQARQGNKMLWIVIMSDMGNYVGDDDWDSDDL